MKKIAMAFVVVLATSVLTTSAFAFGPAWRQDHRPNPQVRHQPAPFPAQVQHSVYHHRPAVIVPVHPVRPVAYVPVRPVRPVVYAPEPARVGIVISIPNLSLLIR
ncbi:MAG TPA: hypothetical protein PK621_07980 [Syntrophales bacterium]|nr:hypothetical protein [Syntrophales bacterium]